MVGDNHLEELHRAVWELSLVACNVDHDRAVVLGRRAIFLSSFQPHVQRRSFVVQLSRRGFVV